MQPSRIASFGALASLVFALGCRDRGAAVGGARSTSGTGPPEQVASKFVTRLESGTPTERAAAVLEATTLDLDALLPILERAAQDDDSGVRATAAQALGPLRAERAVPTLAELASDASPLVRRRAVQSLAMLASELASGPLATALQDRDEEVRREAARGLAEAASQSAVPHLIAALGDDDLEVRARAATALGRLRAGEARSALQTLSSSANPFERGAALAALERLPR